jgi:hypothetical protein
MFETSQTDEKSSGSGIWIILSIVIVLAVIGTLAYMNRDTTTKSATTTASGAGSGSAAPVQTNADAAHDLRIVSAKMDKDYTGTTAVWSVDIKNQSSTFTYSDVAYETTYAGGDNSVLLQNHGKVPLTLGPGEEETTEVRDALYPNGTAWYKFRVTDATATK